MDGPINDEGGPKLDEVQQRALEEMGINLGNDNRRGRWLMVALTGDLKRQRLPSWLPPWAAIVVPLIAVIFALTVGMILAGA